MANVNTINATILPLGKTVDEKFHLANTKHTNAASAGFTNVLVEVYRLNQLVSDRNNYNVTCNTLSL